MFKRPIPMPNAAPQMMQSSMAQQMPQLPPEMMAPQPMPGGPGGPGGMNADPRLMAYIRALMGRGG